MCPLTVGASASSAENGLISRAVWEQVLQIAKQVRSISVCGFGEPTTHPRFRDMLRELDAGGVEISFSTNGIGGELLAPALTALTHLKHVNVSIDSPDPDVFRAVRGGDVRRVISGARAIVEAVGSRVSVTAASVVMRSNIRSLVALPATLSDIGIRMLVLQSLHDFTPESAREHILAPSGRLDRVLDEIAAECLRNGIALVERERVRLDACRPAESMRRYFLEPFDGLAQTRACTVPFNIMYLDSAGRVYPCCYAPADTVFGYADKESLEAIWNGPAAAGFRHAMLRRETTPEVCRRCTVMPWDDLPQSDCPGVIESGEQMPDGRIRLTVRNTGTAAWTRQHPLALGTARPRDRSSSRWHPTWSAPNRVATMRDEYVPPGLLAVLEAQLAPAVEEEFFELLIEGQLWLPGTLHSYW